MGPSLGRTVPVQRARGSCLVEAYFVVGRGRVPPRTVGVDPLQPDTGGL